MRNKSKSQMSEPPQLPTMNDPVPSDDEMSEIGGDEFDPERASDINRNNLLDLQLTPSSAVQPPDELPDEITLDGIPREEWATFFGGYEPSDPNSNEVYEQTVDEIFPSAASPSEEDETSNNPSIISDGYADDASSENSISPLGGNPEQSGNESATASSSLWPTIVQNGEQTGDFDETAFLDPNAADSDEEDFKSMKIVKLFKTGKLSKIEDIPKKKSKNSDIVNFVKYGENKEENFLIDNSERMAQSTDTVASLYALASLAHSIAISKDAQDLKDFLLAWFKRNSYFKERANYIPEAWSVLIEQHQIPRTGVNIDRLRLTYHILNLMILAESNKLNYDDLLDLDTASTFQFIDMAAALPN